MDQAKISPRLLIKIRIQPYDNCFDYFGKQQVIGLKKIEYLN